MFIYSIFIYLYIFLIRIASLWNTKAALWIKGRQNWYFKMKEAIAASAHKKVIWIHCASLGEFEQGRPIIESIRNHIPNTFIVLTFFSPSGYEIRKNYSTADLVFYLPADTPGNARKFLDLLQPELVIFVKYEYWFNFLQELKQRKIPTLMVSGIFFEKQLFFQWYGKWAQKFFRSFVMIFVQDLHSKKLLENIGITHTIVAGDTRFDRVNTIANQFSHIPEIKNFCDNHLTYVLGSTWEDDEALWQEWISKHPEHRYIIAPHEIDEEHLKSIEQKWPNCIRFSHLNHKTNSENSNVLIVDNIGMLSKLYFYADITYIGGGFGDGIHNTLEAAVYGKPVLFGPEHGIFQEASGLILVEAGFVVHNAKELENCLNILINDPEKLKKSSIAAAAYVRNHAGATEMILKYIQENLLFSNNPN